MVVDLAVDGEGEGLIIVDEGLGAGVWMNSLARIPSYVPIESSPTDTNDTQTLMRQDYKSPPLVFLRDNISMLVDILVWLPMKFPPVQISYVNIPAPS